MEWVDLRNENQITFHSLPPGNYRLRIIGSNHDAVWNREGILLPISVLPPFWKTAWFRAILLMLVLLLLFQLYRVRIRKIEKRYGEDLRLEKFLIKKNVSEKEKEVIALILEGCSNKDIEDKLFISYGTVKNHVYNIFKKLDVKSRVQLISVMNRIKKD